MRKINQQTNLEKHLKTRRRNHESSDPRDAYTCWIHLGRNFHSSPEHLFARLGSVPGRGFKMSVTWYLPLVSAFVGSSYAQGLCGHKGEACCVGGGLEGDIEEGACELRLKVQADVCR